MAILQWSIDGEQVSCIYTLNWTFLSG
jgi:hypothetical protein